MSLKNCYICGRDLPLEGFNSKRKECKDCSKGIKLLARYKITQAQYNQKLEDQGGVCTICNRSPNEVGILVQDHDHSCCPGEISCGNCLRDLICSYDNRGLGLFQDDVVRMRAAAEYIEFHRKGIE
jgi:hypothetical protein